MFEIIINSTANYFITQQTTIFPPVTRNNTKFDRRKLKLDLLLFEAGLREKADHSVESRGRQSSQGR